MLLTMENLIIAVLAFAVGFICGKLTNKELWMWANKHGSKKNKKH